MPRKNAGKYGSGFSGVPRARSDRMPTRATFGCASARPGAACAASMASKNVRLRIALPCAVGYPFPGKFTMQRLLLLLLLVPAFSLAQAPVSTEVRLAQTSFHEYLELLSMPNDATNAPDIQKNTD